MRGIRTERNCARSAFTLVELLVVIAIIGLLVAILLPAVQSARESARRTSCTNNLKQIALAILNHHDTKRHFPAGYMANVSYVDGATDTTPGWGWATAILPYVEEGNLYQQIAFTQPIESAANSTVRQTRLQLYLCPSDLVPDEAFQIFDDSGAAIATAAPASYAACVGGDESDASALDGKGAFYRNSRTRIAEITDGTNATILIGEHAWSNAKGIWAGAINRGVCRRGELNPNPATGASQYPAPTLTLAHSHLNNATTDEDGGLDDFSSTHVEGSNFAFADGSVRFIRSIPSDLPNGDYTPEDLIFQALGTRNGGEVLGDNWSN